MKDYNTNGPKKRTNQSECRQPEEIWQACIFTVLFSAKTIGVNYCNIGKLYIIVNISASNLRDRD